MNTSISPNRFGGLPLGENLSVHQTGNLGRHPFRFMGILEFTVNGDLHSPGSRGAMVRRAGPIRVIGGRRSVGLPVLHHEFCLGDPTIGGEDGRWRAN